jgi:hypothetical protein
MDASSSTVMESPSAHPDDHSRRPLLTLEQSAADGLAFQVDGHVEADVMS